MEPVVFLSTSPTYMLVPNGLVLELKNANRIHLVGQTTVQGLIQGKHQNPFLYGRWYDFSRTAGSVLRMYMLEASGMAKLYNPPFSTAEINRHEFNTNLYPFGYPMNMAQVPEFGANEVHTHRARRLAAEFDRLFPHSLMECELDNLAVGMTRTLSGHMYVIYFDRRPRSILYQIDATMDVTLEPTYGPQGMKNVHARAHVVVAEYHFDEPMPIPSVPYNFPRFNLVKSLIEEWSSS